mmetsp:Transcript_4444/g.9462  ORF Transcript_4444/g.9462 Transcript_4444/m.9462 type:complete len:211 (+) Transcript_4444:397-1029(+)
MRSIEASLPRMWETMRYLAPLEIIFFSRSSGSIRNPSSVSTYTALPWACWIALGTAVKVKALVSTLSPGCTPAQRSARKRAEPQLLSATQYLWPVYSVISFSHIDTTDDSASGTLYRYMAPFCMSSTAWSIPDCGTGSACLMFFFITVNAVVAAAGAGAGGAATIVTPPLLAAAERNLVDLGDACESLCEVGAKLVLVAAIATSTSAVRQ